MTIANDRWYKSKWNQIGGMRSRIVYIGINILSLPQDIPISPGLWPIPPPAYLQFAMPLLPGHSNSLFVITARLCTICSMFLMARNHLVQLQHKFC